MGIDDYVILCLSISQFLLAISYLISRRKNFVNDEIISSLTANLHQAKDLNMELLPVQKYLKSQRTGHADEQAEKIYNIREKLKII